jgi:hypothetical protein
MAEGLALVSLLAQFWFWECPESHPTSASFFIVETLDTNRLYVRDN